MKSLKAGLGIDMTASTAFPEKFGWLEAPVAVLRPVASANDLVRIAA